MRSQPDVATPTTRPPRDTAFARRTRRHAALARVAPTAMVVALTLGAAHGADDEVARPTSARPSGAARFLVSVTTHRDKLSEDGGGLGGFSGEVWFQPVGGGKYEGGTSLSPANADLDDDDAVLTKIAFRLDASLNPYGEEETLGVPDLDESLLLRAASSSDLAIAPMRMLVPHLMEFEGSSRESRIEVKCSGGGATVEMEAKRLGTQRINGTQHDLVFTRILRRFEPSGYQLHDFVLTAKDSGEDFISASYALRLLVHPTLTVAGTHPTAGLLRATTLEANVMTWASRKTSRAGSRSGGNCPPEDMAALRGHFELHVGNALFKRMEVEGVGDPFDSPASLALQDTRLLDERTAQRLINTGNPKALAMLSALMVESRFSYDPATHLKLWKAEDDPARRLLLAAGARVGGAKDPRFAEELKLAIESSDRAVLRAAACLAKALGDSNAEKEALKKAAAG